MADIRPNVILPDERAAGVISGSDPYRELELYLEKVNEEFGEVFERWLGSSDITKLKQNGKIKPCSEPLATGIKNMCNGNQIKINCKEATKSDIEEVFQNSNKSRSLPTRAKIGNVRNFRKPKQIYAFAFEKVKTDEKEWADNLMADFEKLIALELSQLQINAEKKESEEIMALPNSDSSTSTDSNSSTGSLKKNPKTFRRSLSDGCERKDQNSKENSDAILINVKSLGEEVVQKESHFQLPPRRPKRMPSPVKLKKFFRSGSPFGRRGKKEFVNSKKTNEENECYKQTPNDNFPQIPLKRRKSSGSGIPTGLQNFLTKIRPVGVRNESPNELTSGFNTMDSSAEDCKESLVPILSSVSTATQTSPSLSRSSSFTWMSDCSSSIILNTPGSQSDVNDEKSFSSGRSSSSPVRLQCDNGCGSECDCATSGSRDSSAESPDSNGLIQENSKERQKLKRKETWEKIRRRHSELLRVGNKSYEDDSDVWVRRESVYTQTHDENDIYKTFNEENSKENSISKWLESDRFDENHLGLPLRTSEETNIRSVSLERNKSWRPQYLPTAPLTVRSLVSPIDCELKLPSSSSASLKLSNSSMAPELLGNKSSSAPVIMKQALVMKKDLIQSGDVKKRY